MDFYQEKLEPMLRKTAKMIEETPHMQDIVEGTMGDERFRFQIMQNYQYLCDYLRTWATALGKSYTYEEMSDILTIINDNYQGINYNREYWAKQIGVTTIEMDKTIESNGKRSYTAFQSMVAHTSDMAGMLCAVFPCGIMYTYFGEDLLPKCHLDKDNKFYQWLYYYTTDHYLQEAANKKKLINKYCEGKNEKETNRLLEICAYACNYEILQWQDTYHNMTTWPLDEIFPERIL